MKSLSRALHWSQRNALILLPTCMFALYVGWYIAAFPRYSNASLPNASIRFCRYAWQESLWTPLAWVEGRMHERFSLASLEQYRIDYDDLWQFHALESAYP